jgi:hypothetical protein
VLHRDEQGPPAFADAAHRLLLRPLRVEAAAEIAVLYVPPDGVAIPLETLLAESEGVPLRVHRAASGWAHAPEAQQLEAAADQAAVDQGGLRTAQAKVAGGVTDLQLARERTGLYLLEEPIDPSAPEVCPFRGLAPFDAAHAEYFFGRERLVADLVARLVGSTLIAVVGPSGSGKSSLIRAGLLPSLSGGALPGSERWPQVLMRPGERPLAELVRALARIAPVRDSRRASIRSPRPWSRPGRGARRAGRRSARGDLHRLPRRGRTDRLRGGDRRDRGRPRPAGLVVLGIRADFYGRCAGYPEFAAQMSANNVLVGPMRREELRRAIELPPAERGCGSSRCSPRRWSATSPTRPGLPLLSTTLVELWQSAAAAPCAAPRTSEAAASTGRWPGSLSASTLGSARPSEGARAILLGSPTPSSRRR